MNRDEVEAYLSKWYPRDLQNPKAPSRFRTVLDDVVDGCAGYTVMHTDRNGTDRTTFVPAEVTTAQLDDIMTSVR